MRRHNGQLVGQAFGAWATHGQWKRVRKKLAHGFARGQDSSGGYFSRPAVYRQLQRVAMAMGQLKLLNTRDLVYHAWAEWVIGGAEP